MINKRVYLVFNLLPLPKRFLIYVSIEAVARRCSVKKVFLKVRQNSRENTCTRASFLTKKNTLAQVFSCQFCEIFKNTYFYRTLLVATSVSNTVNLKNVELPSATLDEKCLNTKFFLVRIRENIDQKKLHIWTLFTKCKYIVTTDLTLS